MLLVDTAAPTGGNERLERLPSRPGACTSGIFEVPDLLVQVIGQAVDRIGRSAHTLVVSFSSPLDASCMPFVDRFVSTVVGVIVEMEEVGYHIDLVADVSLSASEVT